MESLNEEKTIDIFGIVPYTFQVMIVTQKYGQNIFLKGGGKHSRVDPIYFVAGQKFMARDHPPALAIFTPASVGVKLEKYFFLLFIEI